MARRALSIVVLLLVPALATAQSLGEAAAREKAKRDSKRGKSAPAPTYTDEDLKDPSKPEKKSGEGTSSGGQPRSRSSTARRAPEATAEAAPSVSAGDESVWRQRARGQREAVRSAEKAIEDAQSRLNALMLDRDPTSLGDPNRLQTIEARKNEARSALEAARLNLAEAQKGLQDLEDEARRNSVPPGWLR